MACNPFVTFSPFTCGARPLTINAAFMALPTSVSAFAISATRRSIVPVRKSHEFSRALPLVMCSEDLMEGVEQKHTPILVLQALKPNTNVANLIRTAAALGVEEVFVVGSPKLHRNGAHSSDKHVRFTHFWKLAEAVEYLHDVRGAQLFGVEITSESKPVHHHPFHGTTAFLMGNEGTGLTPSQLALCDQLVYIPQHSGATASLNVNAACAIVLHHFALWAGFPEATRDGYKYVLNEPPSSVPYSGAGLNQMRTLRADGTVDDTKGQRKEIMQEDDSLDISARQKA